MLLIFPKVAFLKLRVTCILPLKVETEVENVCVDVEHKVCYGRKDKVISLHV